MTATPIWTPPPPTATPTATPELVPTSTPTERPGQCGDGTVQTEPEGYVEECDDGNGDAFDGCTNGCAVCGNGTVRAPEQCDDGNQSADDACRNDCRTNVCGDGYRNPAAEQCASFDRNGDGRLMVDELVAAVRVALEGCGPPAR